MMVFLIGLTCLVLYATLGRTAMRAGISKYRRSNKYGRPGRNARPAIHATAKFTTDNTVGSLAQTEAIDQGAIFFHVRTFQVIKQLAPLAHHAQQAAARVMVLDV